MGPVFLPGKSHGQRSLVDYSPKGRKESGTTEQLSTPLLKTPPWLPSLSTNQVILHRMPSSPLCKLTSCIVFLANSSPLYLLFVLACSRASLISGLCTGGIPFTQRPSWLTLSSPRTCYTHLLQKASSGPQMNERTVQKEVSV